MHAAAAEFGLTGRPIQQDAEKVSRTTKAQAKTPTPQRRISGLQCAFGHSPRFGAALPSLRTSARSIAIQQALDERRGGVETCFAKLCDGGW